MRKKVIGFALTALLFAFCPPAEPQQKIPRIGILEPGLATNVCNDGFRRGLRALSYVENQNILIETRFAEWHFNRLPNLVAQLVQLKTDVIWTHSRPAIIAAKRATTTIPIVAGVSRDLVEQGIVASLARPGGNITGMELRDSEIIGKRLEVLKEAIPNASRVAVFVDPNDISHAFIPGNIEQEARALRLQLKRIEASGSDGLDKAFGAIVEARANALMLPEGTMFSQNRSRIFNMAISKRLPTAAGGSHFAEAGSLISYGASVVDLCQRSAYLVDKILKGAKPAELPIERPAKFEFIINLKTAKQIGLKLPPNVLARADKVIR